MTEAQQAIRDAPVSRKIWLEGGAGAGKTRVGIARALRLIELGAPAESILIFVPQRSLAQPYIAALRAWTAHRGGQVWVQTIGSLALQMVETFWFLIAAEAGFKHPRDLPNFLSLELLQYFMTRAIEPLVDERDYFNSVRIDRARLYSQIVDNMNKAALVGFPISEIGARLKSALASGVEQAHIFDDAQTCAQAFRRYCLEHNLLDFSLQLEVFRDHVWRVAPARKYLLGRCQHLIVDGVEEDNPASHALLSDLLESCQSALIIYDRDAGFRRFLGADPDSALRLRERCDMRTTLDQTFVMGAEVKALGERLAGQLGLPVTSEAAADPRPALVAEAHRYHPEMVDWVARQVDRLIRERDASPDNIVILAPYMSDALRFGLADRLAQYEIPLRSHRPSRALRDEPAARTLLTLARLAHPHWNMPPTDFDIVFALMTSIKDLDLVRAKLLTEMLYRQGRLLPFAEVRSSAMQERVTFDLGERYDRLAAWINRYIDGDRADAIDIFFRRLFGGLLSRAGFGFYADVDAGNISMNLVDSARGFRWSLDFMRRYDEQFDAEPRLCENGGPRRHRQLLSARLDRRRRRGRAHRAGLYLPAEQPPGRLSVLAQHRQRGLVAPIVSALDPPLRSEPRLDPRRAMDRGGRAESEPRGAGTAAAGFDAPLPQSDLPGLQRAQRKRLRAARACSSRRYRACCGGSRARGSMFKPRPKQAEVLAYRRRLYGRGGGARQRQNGDPLLPGGAAAGGDGSGRGTGNPDRHAGQFAAAQLRAAGQRIRQGRWAAARLRLSRAHPARLGE